MVNTRERKDEKVAAIHRYSSREWTRRVQQKRKKNQAPSRSEFLHTHQRLYFEGSMLK